MRKMVGLVFAVVIVGLVAVWLARPPEPIYGGRKLTDWLRECSDTPLMETQRLAQAQAAVRAIGADKALPTLLRLVSTRDGPLKEWMMDLAEKHRVRSSHLRRAWERQQQGLAGFEVLGTNCAGAVGNLTKLLEDKDLAVTAVRCLDHIGRSAGWPLRQCLTHRDWHVRELSIAALASATEDVEVYLDRISPRLGDIEPIVRCAAVQAIGAQNHAPGLAVPLLISALDDPSEDVPSLAARALSGFRAKAASAVPTLTHLVATGSEGQCREALDALAVIAPTEAVPLLSNAVVNGSPLIVRTASRSLKSLAPDLGFDLTLAGLKATDADRRSAALSVAGLYELGTPGIVEALKSAASDPDPEIANRATLTMRELLRKQKEKAGTTMLLPGEPSYQGKPLGEWLAMRQQDSGLATNAVRALLQMGTNVIPALLARLAYTDPVFGLDDYEVSMGAATGLVAMGAEAKPALPDLAALVDSENPDLAVRAMIATMGAGADAIPCLIKGLTNRAEVVRSEGVHFLSDWGTAFPEQRKAATPYVIPLLRDPDSNLRQAAADLLKELDPQAAVRAGVK
jgi:HEAT repeat protein